MNDYGKQIRTLREAAGINQRTLATRAGMTNTNLCESEGGTRPLSMPEFLRLQAALHELVAERDAAWQDALKGLSA